MTFGQEKARKKHKHCKAKHWWSHSSYLCNKKTQQNFFDEKLLKL